jgi:hypothetical protein
MQGQMFWLWITSAKYSRGEKQSSKYWIFVCFSSADVKTKGSKQIFKNV